MPALLITALLLSKNASITVTASALSPSDAFDSADDADHFLLFFLFLLIFFHSLLQFIFVHRGRLKGLALHPMSQIQSHVVGIFSPIDLMAILLIISRYY